MPGDRLLVRLGEVVPVDGEVLATSTPYPRLADQLAGEDPLTALSHTHREIFRLGYQLERMNADLTDPPDAGVLVEVQRVLRQLDVVLSLHFAQEDELYHNLDGR